MVRKHATVSLAEPGDVLLTFRYLLFSNKLLVDSLDQASVSVLLFSAAGYPLGLRHTYSLVSAMLAVLLETICLQFS